MKKQPKTLRYSRKRKYRFMIVYHYAFDNGRSYGIGRTDGILASKRPSFGQIKKWEEMLKKQTEFDNIVITDCRPMRG